MKLALLMILLVGVMLASGCVSDQPQEKTEDTTDNTEAPDENIALETLENELEQAIQDIDLEDLENSLLE